MSASLNEVIATESWWYTF